MATTKAITSTSTDAAEQPSAAKRGKAGANEIVHKFGPNGEIFTRYAVTLRFRDKIMGGTPKRADVIEAWLRKNTGVTDQDEMLMMTRRTLGEMGVEIAERATMEEMIEASKNLAMERNTNGFKSRDGALIIETRQVKAGLKAWTNALFAGERWGRTYKGPKNYLAERVFVEGDTISLGVAEPHGVDMVIGHVTGPQGDKSTLTYHEYVRQPQVEFVVYSLEDCISPEQWLAIWQLGQEDGIGALRSQGHGRFDVENIVRLRAMRPVNFAIVDEA